MAKIVKRKKGRPTTYKSEYCEQAYKLCLLGFTDDDLAAYFNVHQDTIYEWKKVYKLFSESIKRGKEIADIEVVESLRKRAMGYQYDEVTYEKIEMKIDGIAEEDDIKTEANKKKVITKEIAPDVTAQIFWLKNRQSKRWRDKQEVGITDKEGNDLPIQIIQLPDNGRAQYNPSSTGLPNKSP